MADLTGQLRKSAATQWTVGVGLAAEPKGCEGGADLRGKLRLRADCGLWLGLLWWEKVPASHMSLLKVEVEWS